MAKKANITNVSSGYASGVTLNSNFEAINNKFDNTLSLDGSTPNAMNADLDMNSNDILNVKTISTDGLIVNGEVYSPREEALVAAGSWDAYSGSFPSSAVQGTFYIVSTAGTVDGQVFEVGDWLIPLVDGASTTTFNSNWMRADYSNVLPDWVVSITMLGGVGDNVTDDSAAFVAADALMASGVANAVFIPAGTFYCPETTYKPVGLYYGPGSVRFGGDGTYTDTEIYPASSTPAPIYMALHGDNRRGRNMYTGTAFASLNRTTANFNTGYGDAAVSVATNMRRTTAIGSWAMRYVTNGSYTDAIGAGAGQHSYGNRNAYIGNNAGKWCGSQNPLADFHDFWNVQDIADPDDDEPEIWANKGFELKFPTIRAALLDGDVATVYANPAAPAPDEIVSFGNVNPALIATSTDQVRGNIFFGRDAGIHVLKSLSSLGSGYKALAQAIGLTATTALGRSAGEKGLLHNESTFVGAAAGYEMMFSDGVTVIGRDALREVYSASNSVVIGVDAGADIPQTELTSTTDYKLTRSVIIGAVAARQATDPTNAIIIGFGAANDPSLNMNGKMFIGSSSSSATTPTIGGDLGARRVSINRPATSPLLAQLHVNAGTPLTGFVSNVAARTAVFESDAAGGITIATPNTANGNINFADPEDNNAGQIQYNHAANTMGFRVNGGVRLTVKTNTINMTLPTSASGLASGDLWNDGGTVKVA